MTIEEYKKKLILVVKDMESEHGCNVSSVVITKDEIVIIGGETFNGTFKVNIEL